MPEVSRFTIGLVAVASFAFGGLVFGPAPHAEPLTLSDSPVTIQISIDSHDTITRDDYSVTTNPAPVPAPEVQLETLPQETIQEDDPRFDCTTMGNHECGIEVDGVWYLDRYDCDGNWVDRIERQPLGELPPPSYCKS